METIDPNLDKLEILNKFKFSIRQLLEIKKFYSNLFKPEPKIFMSALCILVCFKICLFGHLILFRN